MLGAPPVITFASVHKLPKHLDELAVAGGLVGAPIRVCKAKTVDLIVPAEAEIVVEGFIDTEWLEPEGSFGESHGYMNLKEYNAVFRRDRHHAAQACRAGLHYQPGDAERIEPDQARGLRTRFPASFAPPPEYQRSDARLHARAADQLAQADRDPVRNPTRSTRKSGARSTAPRPIRPRSAR